MRVIVFFLFSLPWLSSQGHKIFGTVYNDKVDLLTYSSVTIKGTTIGASANNRARFSINIAPGKYTVVCQHIGYATKEKEVVVNTEDVEVSFVLTEQKIVIKEVIVKSDAED